MASTEVHGRPARYADLGDGPPVLFLHGWGIGVGAYRRPLGALVDLGARVVAPALPGFGGTAPLPRTTFEDYADWVADFAATVDLGRAVVVGHSFGGGVAIATAHRHRRRVRALVLVNAVGGLSLADRPWWRWGLHFPADAAGLRQVARVVPPVVRGLGRNLARNPLGVWRAAELARTADLTAELEDLRRTRLPVRAVTGNRDRVIPQAAFEALCEAVGAEGELVEGTHSWLLADPAALSQAVGGHLRRRPRWATWGRRSAGRRDAA
jgi:pimeloyl-ACP methyl ester carboxylesterase